MITKEQLLKLAQEKVSSDSIDKKVGSFVADWYQKNEPHPVTLLYLVAALIDISVNGLTVTETK